MQSPQGTSCPSWISTSAQLVLGCLNDDAGIPAACRHKRIAMVLSVLLAHGFQG
jgi:hypothetical protein